jgi:hypothetical protein
MQFALAVPFGFSYCPEWVKEALRNCPVLSFFVKPKGPRMWEAQE